MTAAPLPFKFPVLALGSNGKWIEALLAPHDFLVCESWRVKFRDGMGLADSSGLCWTIIGVQNLGATGGFWERLLRSVLKSQVYRVSCELSEPVPLSLDRLKDRVCAAMDADPDAWREEDVPEEGWNDPWLWWRQQHEAFKGRVMASRNVPEIIHVLFDEPRQDVGVP